VHAQEAQTVCTVSFPVRRSLDADGGQDAEVGDAVMCDATGLFALQDLQQLLHAGQSSALHIAKLQYLTLAARGQPRQ